MDSWPLIQLSELVKVKGRVGWKGYKTSDLRETGPIVFSGTEIKSQFHMNLTNVKHLTQEKFDESPEIILQDKDVLVSTRGTLGEIGFYRKEYGPATINPSLVILSEYKGVPEFLYYFFVSSLGQEALMAISSGSTVPAIYQADLKKLEIPCPPNFEQRAIAEVLSSLDDKIDLLHRNNKTLEEMAEALFRQWFVVEAKEEWEVKKLDDILTTVGGTTPSTTNPEFWDGNICWTSPRDITTLSGIYLFDTERKITEKGLSKISSGLLPKGSLLMSSRAPVGVLAFAEVPVAINQGYIAILDNKGFDKLFIYLWLKHNMEYIHSFSNGSTFMEISKSAFKSLEIVLPPLSIVKSFIDNIKPLFDKIKHNELTIKTLSRSRDILLPKLMSGQVRVKTD